MERKRRQERGKRERKKWGWGGDEYREPKDEIQISENSIFQGEVITCELALASVVNIFLHYHEIQKMFFAICPKPAALEGKLFGILS